MSKHEPFDRTGLPLRNRVLSPFTLSEKEEIQSSNRLEAHFRRVTRGMIEESSKYHKHLFPNDPQTSALYPHETLEMIRNARAQGKLWVKIREEIKDMPLTETPKVQEDAIPAGDHTGRIATKKITAAKHRD